MNLQRSFELALKWLQYQQNLLSGIFRKDFSNYWLVGDLLSREFLACYYKFLVNTSLKNAEMFLTPIVLRKVSFLSRESLPSLLASHKRSQSSHWKHRKFETLKL